MFTKPKTLFQQQVSDITMKNDAEKVLTDLIELNLLRGSEKNKDLLTFVDLYRYLGPEKSMGVFHILAGKTISFPKKESFIENIQIALCYYFRKIRNKTWSEVKELLSDEELESVKLGVQVKQLQTFIDKMSETISNKNEILARNLLEEALHEHDE